MIHHSSKIKSTLKIILPIVFLTVLGLLVQIFVVSEPTRTALWLKSFGPYLIVVYVIIQATAIIFPPFPGGAFRLALIAILGPAVAIPIAYLVVTPCFLINFLLAKKFGRPFVKKFIGHHAIEKVDHYATDAGTGTVLMLKLFMDDFFDFLSYGIGLTNISFKKFFWINLLAGIPSALIEYFIFSRSTNFVFSLGLLGLTGLAFTGTYTLYHHLTHRKKVLS